MSTITFARATAEDIAAFSDMANKPSILAWIARLDDEPVALGGFALAQWRWIGFIDITPKGRRLLAKNAFVRAALVRGAMHALREAKARGIKYIYADADMSQKRAVELLLKLGFEPDARSARLYRWSSKS